MLNSVLDLKFQRVTEHLRENGNIKTAFNSLQNTWCMANFEKASSSAVEKYSPNQGLQKRL